VNARLELRSIWAGYGGSDVLRDLNLSVPAGSITCVVGPNGAGKSTILRLVSGQLKPRLGSVLFDGVEIGGRKPRHILSLGIVQVAQNHTLFPGMTVRENVALGAFMVRDKAEVARRLERVSEVFPIVRDRADDKAGSLSGGQQRQIEFARCLMLEPKLVVLDEPSMGLDPKTLRTVLRKVREIWAEGRTVLLVEQNVRAGLSLATHAVVVESGHVRLEGTGAELNGNAEIAHLYLGAGTTRKTA
jgi:ABC-type branched-subunit amino acid transport system ATPase component